ncbi:hypothetical protein SAMN04488519_11312 [Algoriphagus ornithinivorans]|uniref:Polysaccharide biosynthesis C-terminal domain-containing protein n=1 Tax=Algoriphagus ornithinivorans TaxID=226506 RepID=A0A1I5JPF9_9BACT|nr:hypothetical protein [Algoriphagus ornithinivorans]SFO74226.1 hypothetical protein SAMN04488519_11312 [Algoriphagus ornithinivorans]
MIGTLLTANHKPAWSALLGTISNTLVLLFLWLGNALVADSLFIVVFICTGVLLLVFSVGSLNLFSNQFKRISPTISFFRKDKVNSLFSLGVHFFVIQITVVIIFSTDSMIITHTLGPREVTTYHIVLRYFGVVAMAAGIVITPFWSAYTEASLKNDFTWIKSALKKQLLAMIFVVAMIVILLILSKWLIPFWIQKETNFSYNFLIVMAFYALILVWNNIFFLLNGLSITNVKNLTSILGILINIPLSIYFAQMWGYGGVILATIISLSFLQYLALCKHFHT